MATLSEMFCRITGKAPWGRHICNITSFSRAKLRGGGIFAAAGLQAPLGPRELAYLQHDLLPNMPPPRGLSGRGPCNSDAANMPPPPGLVRGRKLKPDATNMPPPRGPVRGSMAETGCYKYTAPAGLVREEPSRAQMLQIYRPRGLVVDAPELGCYKYAAPAGLVRGPGRARMLQICRPHGACQGAWPGSDATNMPPLQGLVGPPLNPL